MGMGFIDMKRHFLKIPLHIYGGLGGLTFQEPQGTFPIISLTRFLWLSLFLAQKYRPPHRQVLCNRNVNGGDYVGRNVCNICNDYINYKD